MSWDELFNSMANGKMRKKTGAQYYIFKAPDTMIGGVDIKYITPTQGEIDRARSEVKNKITKKLKNSRVVIIKGRNKNDENKKKCKKKNNPKVKMKSKKNKKLIKKKTTKVNRLKSRSKSKIKTKKKVVKNKKKK